MARTRIENFFTALKIFLICLCISSCAVEKKSESLKSNAEIPPVKLILAQAFSVQKSLFVKANVEVLNDIPADDVVVGAIGLKEGVVKEEHYTPLSKVWNKKIITKGSSLVIPFELPISNISEFQLKCSWGEDAKRAYIEGNLNPPEPKKAELNPTLVESDDGETVQRTLPQKGIVIDSINIEEVSEDCDKAPCKKKVKIKAIVKNFKDSNLKNLSLAFGLFWMPEGKVPKLPRDFESKLPNEEELSFGEINVPPGGSIPFSVNIGKSMVDVKGGEFRPHVRILSTK